MEEDIRNKIVEIVENGEWDVWANDRENPGHDVWDKTASIQKLIDSINNIPEDAAETGGDRSALEILKGISGVIQVDVGEAGVSLILDDIFTLPNLEEIVRLAKKSVIQDHATETGGARSLNCPTCGRENWITPDDFSATVHIGNRIDTSTTAYKRLRANALAYNIELVSNPTMTFNGDFRISKALNNTPKGMLLYQGLVLLYRGLSTMEGIPKDG